MATQLHQDRRRVMPLERPASGIVPRAERTVTLLMLGRLWHQGTDTLCRIRDVSEGGMRIQSMAPLVPGERVRVEPRNGLGIEGKVAWTKDVTAGIQFARTVAPADLLAPPTGANGTITVSRSPRFDTAANAEIIIEGKRLTAPVINIGLGGCAVLANPLFQEGMKGSITVRGLPAQRFVIRWTDGAQAGLGFLERYGFAELADWVRKPELRFAADPKRLHLG